MSKNSGYIVRKEVFLFQMLAHLHIGQLQVRTFNKSKKQFSFNDVLSVAVLLLGEAVHIQNSNL